MATRIPKIPTKSSLLSISLESADNVLDFPIKGEPEKPGVSEVLTERKQFSAASNKTRAQTRLNQRKNAVLNSSPP